MSIKMPSGRLDDVEIEALLAQMTLPDLWSLLGSVRIRISEVAWNFSHTEILGALETRFFGPKGFDREVHWKRVESSLLSNPLALKALNYMEKAGGMPNVIKYNHQGFSIAECSKEIPSSRIYLAYDEASKQWWDQKSLQWWQGKQREQNASEIMDMICLGSAISEETAALGLELMDPECYKYFQTLGEFDQRFATWLKVPKNQKPMIGYRSETPNEVVLVSSYPHTTSFKLRARYMLNVPWSL